MPATENTPPSTPFWKRDLAGGGLLDRAIVSVRSAFTAMGESSRSELALLMTLAVLFYTAVHAPVDLNDALVIAALLYRPIRRAAAFWFFMGAFRFVFNMPEHWYSIDNHQYLITWWCFGIGFALLAADPERALAVTGRRLIGLCFAFAAAWKVMAPDFLSGRFMHWTLIYDGRFASFAENVLGLPAGGNAENQAAVLALFRTDYDLAAPAELVTSDLFQNLGVAMGWWTLLIEATIALCFLLPKRFRVTRFANLALFVFIATTYPIAPVWTFAWLLLAMAVAATPKENRTWLPVAFVTFLMVTLAERAGEIFASVGGS